FLPALPQAWPQGEVAGLRSRGSVEVPALSWRDGVLASATLRHDGARPRALRLRCRTPGTVALGGDDVAQRDGGDGVVVVDAPAGATLSVSRRR
ncbi:MAG: glycoside hydrolase family 95-like protein, partial [Planctomycetota bacterium]